VTFEIAGLSYKQNRKGLPKQNRYISRQMKTSVKEKKKIKDNKRETKHSVTPCGAFGPKDPKESFFLPFSSFGIVQRKKKVRKGCKRKNMFS